MKLREIMKVVNIENGGNGYMASMSKDLEIPYHKLRNILNGEDVFTHELYTKIIDTYEMSTHTREELKKLVTCDLDRRAMSGFEESYARDSYLIPSFEEFTLSLLRRHESEIVTLGYFAKIIRTPLKKVKAIAKGEDVLDDIMTKRILRIFKINEFDKMILFHYSREVDEKRSTSEIGPLIVFLNDALKYNQISKTQFDKIIDVLLPTKQQQINNKLEETMNKLDINTTTLLTRIRKCNDQKVLKPLLVLLYNLNYEVFSEVIKEDKFDHGYETEEGRIIPWKDEIIGEDLSVHDHFNTTDWISYCVKAIGLADETTDNK